MATKNPFFILFLFFTGFFCDAATVTRIMDRQVVLQFQDDEIPNSGDKYYVLDQDSHEEIGLLRITKTKGNRGVAKIIKGSAKPGDQADRKQKPSIANDYERIPADETLDHPKSKKKFRRSSFGIGINYFYATTLINAKSFADGSPAGSGAAAGSSSQFDLFYDRDLSDQWALNVGLSSHSFKTKIDDPYLTMSLSAEALMLDLIGRYSFNRNDHGLWMGGGLGFLSVSKGAYSSNHAIDTAEVTTFTPKSTPLLDASVGYNFRVRDSFIGLRSSLILLVPPTSNDSQTLTHYHLKIGGAFYF